MSDPSEVLRSFTLETFQPLVNDYFTLHLGDGQEVGLRLSQAEATRSSAHSVSGERIPFSLVFVGPPETPLPQRTYEVEHQRLGRFPLFLVPIQPQHGQPRYEAIFS